MYIKITPKASKNYNINNTISLSLKQNHEIVDIQVIDSNKVLITISNEYGIQGIIFDIDKQKILYKIKK